MPSLTLTDPDMILPYNGSERESQTPSPPTQLVYLSNLNARYNPADPPGNRSKKNFSRHAWSHEEGNAGRRLSDIGEELSPSQLSGFEDQEGSGSGSGSGDGSAVANEQGPASSPVVREELVTDQSEGNARSSSSSTVSAGSARASGSRPPDEAQGVSPTLTGGVNTPGNEDESKTSLPDSSVMASAAKGKGPGDEFSSAILSSEAERILENAKKRLTLMEGNLNRARSSVRLTPSPSPSPSSPGISQPLMPHQPGGLYRSISHRKGSALRRQSLLPSQDASTNRHSRVHSETNFPPETNLSTDTKRISRSVSAMGSSSVSNFHHDERSFQYDPTRAYLTHRPSSSSMRSPQLEQARSPDPVQSPLPEESRENSPIGSPKGLGISTEVESRSSGGNFSPVYSSYGPPSRAQSQLQVRDLQYHMKGLHIKISSLKVRTQEDNLRRRSLQSLRTPSPLTAADPWYQNALELRDGRSSRGSTARRDGSSEYARELWSQNEDSQAKGEHYRTEQADASPQEQPASAHTSTAWDNMETAEYDDGRQSAAGSMYEDAEEGEFEDGDIDREALDEILREPLDEDLESAFEEFSPADGLPHEEREDAFDYEHFILHSALGNYTRQMRRASNSSHESTATTRPTHTVQHSRADSVMSDSTVATFATATEGDGEHLTEDEDDLLYWDRRFNHELRHRHVPDAHADSGHVETDRSETPRGPDEDGNVTPTGDGQQSPQSAGTARRLSSATAGSVTPTALVSSLVSTVRAASSPHPGSATPTSGGINDDDTQILELLFQSLGTVCMDLQAITTSPEPDLKAARVLRRRLDAARRVLDGELDA